MRKIISLDIRDNKNQYQRKRDQNCENLNQKLIERKNSTIMKKSLLNDTKKIKNYSQRKRDQNC